MSDAAVMAEKLLHTEKQDLLRSFESGGLTPFPFSKVQLWVVHWFLQHCWRLAVGFEAVRCYLAKRGPNRFQTSMRFQNTGICTAKICPNLDLERVV